ncbi:hypothetical protein BM613_03335 [Sulfoacidibacillus thermotolerans]|uniref:Heme A synthase n=2 Tax=Sulfoacidibacillus thermotolerans TaxID=1765684 RepID=A0A2U3DBA7_SULT2|nr:hypothetical protein BM613_03335 [Sulfoacidibacillus thermotolerans]
MIEYGHRGFVALVTLLLLIFVTLAWINYGRWIEVRALGLIAVSFVFLEALLGALGVVFGDPPAELATHFGVSLIAFSAVLLLHLVIRQIDRLPYAKDQTVPAPLRPFSIPRSFMRITFFTLAYLYIAMYIGAYVANSRSADAFRGLLLPQERMTANNHVFWIDSVHRSIGVGLLLLVIYLLAKAYSLRQHRNDLWHITLGIVSCTVLQILAGILLIASQLAIYAQLLHTAIVTVLFAALCYLALQTLPEPSARTRQLPQTYLPEH